MYPKLILSFLLILALSCNSNSTSLTFLQIDTTAQVHYYRHVKTIPLPAGFERTADTAGSFAVYLRNIELKETKTVYLYNGDPKENQTAQYALLNISVGNLNLQQCADAVMRLRAEYLFALKQFERIIFFDNDKTAYPFLAPYTRDHFSKYLNRVFGMCGSASLSKQLKPVTDFTTIQAGDVIIRGGFPGHAVIVMDVAVNASGEKIYLLAQSYMPAQDIHVLKNPANENISPWYQANGNHIIQTPEYSFTKDELKRW